MIRLAELHQLIRFQLAALTAYALARLLPRGPLALWLAVLCLGMSAYVLWRVCTAKVLASR